MSSESGQPRTGLAPDVVDSSQRWAGRGPSVLELARDGRDVGRARRFVESQLLIAGLSFLVDDAVLAVSELTTNALIHTDSGVSVSVSTGPELVHVAVRDGSPIPPVPGSLDDTSMCGRGLVLVTRLSSRWGVDRAAGGGKSVWFEMQPRASTEVDELDVSDLLDMWTLEAPGHEDASPPSATRDLRRVRIPGVRADLLHGAKSHLDDLVRECVLVSDAALGADGARDELSDLAQRLTELSVRLVEFRNQIRRQALVAGTARVFITLDLTLPASLRPALAEYRDVLDEVDRLSELGVLLAGTDTQERQQFRRWKLDRVIEQLQP